MHCVLVFSQRKLTKGSAKVEGVPFQTDTSSTKGKSTGYAQRASIDMYKQLTFKGDSINVDTTLTISKYYKFNYLQRDNFGLMPFANMGQTYNELEIQQTTNSSTPWFGARARHFNYMEHDDINYYQVPTPWTRLTYKTAFQQGQLLDAFFTVNLTKQFNFAIAYKGVRSIGNYINVRTSTGNFRFISSYNSKNERYNARGYVVTQDLSNQENGGLRDEDISNFTDGTEEFLDRTVFDPNFDNAENILKGKRFYLEQDYKVVQNKDSLDDNELSFYHKIKFEDKYYEYSQTSPSESYFGEAFTNNIRDRSTLENFETNIGFNWKNSTLGDLSGGLFYNDINYGYDAVVIFPEQTIPNRIKTNFIGIEGAYTKSFNKLKLQANTKVNFSDEFAGLSLNTLLDFRLNEDITIQGEFNVSSRLPNYNYLLYQSDYINYNWYNFNDFNNVDTQQIKFKLKSKTYGHINLDISNVTNYTYFNLVDTVESQRIVKPSQFSGTLQYLKLRYDKNLRFRNFGLDNSILFQNVISDEEVLNVPTLVLRNTLYYSDQIFKKAMTFQTGITLNYFTDYNMNRYDPLLAEFYVQNEEKIGGFPMLDFFINAKIRQTRIFLIAEHFNSSFTGYDYFSAPNHPYRDFTIRFGLVWDFFL